MPTPLDEDILYLAPKGAPLPYELSALAQSALKSVQWLPSELQTSKVCRTLGRNMRDVSRCP